MSVESLSVVLHHSRAKGTAKLIMVGIANHDGDGGAWPTVATLAKYGNVDVRNVQRSLDKLVQLGELVVHLQQGGTHATPDHQRANRYEVLVSCPPWCDRTTQHRDTRESRQSHLRGLSTAPRRQRHPPAPAPPVPPGASATPPPGASATRTILGTTPPPVSTQPQDAGARCEVCSLLRLYCQRSQALVPLEDRHDYRPVRRASG